MIGERNALKESLDKLAAEVAALKSTKATEPKAASPADDADLRKSVAELLAANKRAALAAELGLGDDKQIAKVQEVLKDHPNLPAKEALMLAQSRDPSMFGGTDQRGFNPSQHTSLRPSGAGAPPAPTLKERSVEIAKNRYTNPMQADADEKRLHGDLLRKALGW